MLQHTKLKIVMFLAIFGASSTAQALAPDQLNTFECTIQKLRNVIGELSDLTSKKPYSVFMSDFKKVLDTLRCLSEIKPCGKHTVVDNAFKAMVADLHQSLEKVYNVLVNPTKRTAAWIMVQLKLQGCESFSTIVQRMEEHLEKIISLATRCQPALVKDLTSFRTTTLTPLKNELLPKTLNDYSKGLTHRLSCQ
jgi:hypothetical protein